MTKKIYVTGAQIDAARFIVERSTAQGKIVPTPILMIAEAGDGAPAAPNPSA